MRTLVIVNLLIMSFTANAAGAGHLTDLIAPAVNFVLLFGFMIYKLKGPLSNYFVNKANKVQETFDRAQVKQKEADSKLKMYEEKVQRSDQEVQEILKKATSDSEEFASEYREYTKQRIDKLKVDANQRIKAEETAMVRNLNENLLNQVILNAKNKISSDKNNQKVISKKMLGELV